MSALSRKPLLIAYLGFIAFGAYEGLIGVAWPSMREEFGLPLDALGLLFVFGLVGFVLVSFSSGWIIRKRSLYWLLLSAMSTRSLGLLLMALSPRWEGVIVGSFISALGAGGIDPSTNGYVTSHYSARQLNWLHASFGVGATFGPFLVAAILANDLSWRLSFGILAGIQGVAALLVFLSAKLWQHTAIEDTKAGSVAEASLAATLRLPVVWLSVLIFFIYTGTELSAGQWSYTLMTLGRGIGEIVASTWVAIYWGSFTVGRIFFGFVVERVDVHKFLRSSLLGAVLGAGLLWANPTEWLSFAGLAIMGFALAPIFPVLIATTRERVGRNQVANTIGFQIALAGLGGSILTSLTGVLADSIGLEVIGVFIFTLTVLMYTNFEALQWLTRNKRNMEIKKGG
jgi:fucose permease